MNCQSPRDILWPSRRNSGCTLADAWFVWFPRRVSPAVFDRLMHECLHGGLKSPRIMHEALNKVMILRLVSQGMGTRWVNETSRWRWPERVVALPVIDLNMPLPLALVWRKDNSSPLLQRSVEEVQGLPEVRGLNNRELGTSSQSFDHDSPSPAVRVGPPHKCLVVATAVGFLFATSRSMDV